MLRKVCNDAVTLNPEYCAPVLEVVVVLVPNCNQFVVTRVYSCDSSLLLRVPLIMIIVLDGKPFLAHCK